jgi:ketosteroid isomerase-like protein
MNRLLVLLILGAGALAVAGQTSNAIDDVKAREEAFRQAELHYDTATAGAILADDFVLVSAGDGEPHNKKWFLPLIGDRSAPLEVLEYGPLDIRVYADTAIVLSTTHEKFILNGKPFEFNGPRTAFWVKENGKWMLVAIHASRFPDKRVEP